MEWGSQGSREQQWARVTAPEGAEPSDERRKVDRGWWGAEPDTPGGSSFHDNPAGDKGCRVLSRRLRVLEDWSVPHSPRRAPPSPNLSDPPSGTLRVNTCTQPQVWWEEDGHLSPQGRCPKVSEAGHADWQQVQAWPLTAARGGWECWASAASVSPGPSQACSPKPLPIAPKSWGP